MARYKSFSGKTLGRKRFKGKRVFMDNRGHEYVKGKNNKRIYLRYEDDSEHYGY